MNWEGSVPSKAQIESIRPSCCGQICFSSINLTQKQHEQRDFFNINSIHAEMNVIEKNKHKLCKKVYYVGYFSISMQ